MRRALSTFLSVSLVFTYAVPLSESRVQVRPRIDVFPPPEPTGWLTGQVLAALTEEPLPNVTLTIVGTTLSTTTNILGRFTLL